MPERLDLLLIAIRVQLLLSQRYQEDKPIYVTELIFLSKLKNIKIENKTYLSRVTSWFKVALRSAPLLINNLVISISPDFTEKNMAENGI